MSRCTPEIVDKAMMESLRIMEPGAWEDAIKARKQAPPEQHKKYQDMCAEMSRQINMRMPS